LRCMHLATPSSLLKKSHFAAIFLEKIDSMTV
jgi:hypothetical protein